VAVAGLYAGHERLTCGLVSAIAEPNWRAKAGSLAIRSCWWVNGAMTSPAETDAPNPQAFLTILTTEHFTLQGARGSTISESSARAALYVGSVSGALVALGFFGQNGQRSAAFTVFALIVLPTLYMLGIFTFARLISSSLEDWLYGRAINPFATTTRTSPATTDVI